MMTAEVEKQIRNILRKQRKLAMLAVNPIEKAEIYGAWAGFLGGMKLAGVITKKEYDVFYDELESSRNIKVVNTKETA